MSNTVFSIPSHLFADEPVSDSHPRKPLREFVAGVENAALLVAADSLMARAHYNPVLIHATGLGKTHLLHALCEQVRPRENWAVTYLAAPDYVRSLEHAYELDAVSEVREKHRSVDLLAIDDLQEFAGKEYAQQELLYTLDDRIESDRPVLLASRVPPGELQSMLPGLQSRLASGLCLPVVEPGPQAREAILDEIARYYGIELTAEAKALLIRPMKRATRRLQTVGQLNSAVLELQQNAKETPIPATTVRTLLTTPPGGVDVSTRRIIRLTARHFGMRMGDVVGRSRQQSVVQARGIAIYLSRNLSGVSFEELGRQFDGRDHSTAMHAYRKTEQLLETDPACRRAVQTISRQLGVP